MTPNGTVHHAAQDQLLAHNTCLERFQKPDATSVGAKSILLQSENDCSFSVQISPYMARASAIPSRYSIFTSKTIP